MSDDKFPLCRKAGLKTVQLLWKKVTHVIDASDVEKLLSEAVEVYGIIEQPDGWSVFSRTKGPAIRDTHQARLLLIEPIEKPQTLEDIAREVIQIAKDYCNDERIVKISSGAKRLLGAK